MWTSPSLLFYILTQGLIVINTLTWRWARSCLESFFSLCLGSPAFGAWQQPVMGWQEWGKGGSQPYGRGRPWEWSSGYRPQQAALPSGSLVGPTPAQHVMHCVFHSKLCPRKHFMCLSSVTFPNPELDSSTNVLLLPTLLDTDAQELGQTFCATPMTSSVGKSPCIQVPGLAGNFSVLEEG